MNHIGIITSGGDAPGTNAALRAAARVALASGVKVSGIRHSWEGALRNDVAAIDRDLIHGILEQGGTLLKSSRSRLLTKAGDEHRVIEALAALGIEGLLVIGGDGSQKGALCLAKAGFPVVGIPKTIDNDLGGTDLTIGFQTAVENAVHAIGLLRTHTESHDRVMVVEVMGRHAGWIAAWSGIASGADLILIPERRWNVAEVCKHLQTRHEDAGRSFSLIVIAEGALESQSELKAPREETRKDHLNRPYPGGIGETLARVLEQRTGYVCRSTNLGYTLRGGPPNAADRLLATRLGVAAAEMLLAGSSGVLAGWLRGEVRESVLAESVAALKLVPDADYRLAARFF